MIYKILGNVKDLLLPGSLGVLISCPSFPVFYYDTSSFSLTLVFSVVIFTSLTFLDYKRYRPRPIFECFLTALPFILYLSVFLLEFLGIQIENYVGEPEYIPEYKGLVIAMVFFMTQPMAHGLILVRNGFFIKRNAKLHGTLLTFHLIVISTFFFLGYLLIFFPSLLSFFRDVLSFH